jgi:membrane protein
MSPRQLFDVALLATLTIFGLSLTAGDEVPAARAGQRGGRPETSMGRHPAGTPATGALADSPSEIPARGWLQIGKRVIGRFGQDRVMAEAAGVTFYALLAIFPAIASLISLYGLIADPTTISAHLSLAGGVIPEGGMQIITDQVKSLTSSPHQALGMGAVIGILTSLWSANAGMKALFDALNVVYEARESRGFIHLTLISFAFTIGGLVFIILALSAVVVLPAVLNFVGLHTATDTLLSLARWPLMLAVIALALAFIYRYGPSRSKVKWRWLSWGSAFASLTWIGASAAFSWYVANFGSYNKTYGSLGAAVGFMTWIWISTMIVLVGAELNAEMEHQTAMATSEPGKAK